MKYTDNAINILASMTYKGIGKAWVVKRMNANLQIDEIVFLLNRDAKVDRSISIDDFEYKRNGFKNILDNKQDFMDGVVAIGDENFPNHRGKVKNSEKPIFLFYRGNLSLLSETNRNVAVIGLLEPDEVIEKIEQVVVAKLVDNGSTIISGLALGCDTIAHRQAIVSKGKTVAILPSPLNTITPAKNKDLANEIVVNNGLLITEYLTDIKSKRELVSRYQERNRLQALFSDTIILSASYAENDLGNDSGSRLAMGYALTYHIPRAVIYDSSIHSNNPKFDLNRKLIKEDQTLITINKNNISSSINKIISNKPVVVLTEPEIQQNLF